MERPALFVGDAEEGKATLNESEVRERMKQGLPPESAEEYLLRVRIESNDLPSVVEAHVPEGLKKKQTPYMPMTEPVPSCPSYLWPSEEWERETISTFVDLRQYLRRWKATVGVSPSERDPVPALKDGVGWHIFCLGCVDDEEEASSDVGSTGGGRTPTESQQASGTSAISNGTNAVTPAASAAVATNASTPANEGNKAAAADATGNNNRKVVGTEAGAGTGSSSGVGTGSKKATPAVVVKDPRNDDDAQSSYCVVPVETTSRFDMFTSTLVKTTDAQGDVQEGDHSVVVTSADGVKQGTAAVGSGSSEGPAVITTVTPRSPARGSGGGVGMDEAGENASESLNTPKKPIGREWLRTHPHGTPPTTKLAIQFDQVLTQRVLAFHADWLRENLLSRARAVWVYTLLACLEKPLGSETAALVREILRRCCAQRAEMESPLDENLPAINVIVTITGKFFQQAEAIY